MAILNSVWYLGSTKWTSVTAWTALAVHAAGDIVRQNAAPAVGSERVFICIIAGTSLAGEPAWNITKGSTTAEAAGPTWQECTGQPAVNGDLTNTPTWTALTTVALGQIIQDVAADYYFICTTSSGNTSASEPSWNKTAGLTTNDGSNVWTCIGTVGSFTTAFAAPFARLQTAWTATWEAAGDTTFMSNNHAETQAVSVGNTSPGTAALMNNVYSVSDASVPPTSLTTGGSLNTTVSASISMNGFCNFYNVAFNCGSGASNPSVVLGNQSPPNGQNYYNCSFKVNATSATSTVTIGNANNTNAREGAYNFYNCTFVFSAAGQTLSQRVGTTFISGGSIAATGTIPTVMLSTQNSCFGSMFLRDVNASTVTTTLASVTGNTSTNFLLENCSLHAGVAMTTGTITGQGGVSFKLHNCDSSATNYRFYETNYLGTVQQSTSVTRSGGATNGTTSLSFQITSTANATFSSPYVSPEITIWHNATSSITPTIYLTCASTLTNKDVWVGWEYMGSSLTPIGTEDLTSKLSNPLTSGATLTTDGTSTWTGGLGNNYMIQPTAFTPGMVGPLKARIYIAKPSLTINVDPYDSIAGDTINRSYFIPGQGYLNNTGSSGGGLLTGPGMTGGCNG